MESNCAVLRVSLKPTPDTVSSPFKKSSKIFGVGKTRYVTDLAISPDGEWLVAIAGFKAYVAMTSSLKSGFTKFVSPDRLTCLAFHPGNEYFVTGDTKGVIRSWYCLNDEVLNKAVGVEKKAQTTTMHWHANPVSSLSFTPNGAYLLSGGEEAVLVIWQMSSGKREYVPRVGGPIRSVTVSTPANRDQEYLLLLEDTSFVFISSTTLKISRIFAGVKLGLCICFITSAGLI
jgi:NET1-associated nuclear protein 1 (U3 small nucleolar RNA-associated protein 17)